MRGIRKQMRRFKSRIKTASLPQLKKILVVLSKRLNSVERVSSKKRIKSKIIITQMAIRNRIGTSNSIGSGQLIGGAANWSNQSGAPAPPSSSSNGITSNFVSNMQSGYQKFGCKFLCGRLLVQKNLLIGLQTAGTNPNWQQKVQNKYNYIQQLITKFGCNCNQYQTDFDCKAMRPYCNPITNLTNGGNVAAANGIKQSIANQWNISIAQVDAMYRKCCEEQTSGGDRRYSCGDNGNCYPDPNGQYGSLSDCEERCPDDRGGEIGCEDVTKDWCMKFQNSGSMSSSVISAFASFKSISPMQAASLLKKCCDPTVGGGERRYSCDKKTGNCYADPNGIYATIDACRRECRKPQGGDGRIPCERIMPYCEKISYLVSSNQTQALQTLMNNLAQQFGVTYAVVKDAYLRCCEETGGGERRYSCDRKTGNCYADPNGIYTSIADCKKECRPDRGNGPCPPNDKSSPWYTMGPTQFCNSDYCNPNSNHPDCVCCPNDNDRMKYSCDRKTGNCYADPNGMYNTMADCQKECRRDRGGDRRMKDCYDCNRKGGVVMNRFPINQPCPKGWTESAIGSNGRSTNPCKERSSGTPPTQGEMNNFSGMWFNDGY